LRSEKEAIYYQLLVLRCRRGDKAALEELIQNWERRLFYYVRRLVDDEEDAWDILQEIFYSPKHGNEPLEGGIRESAFTRRKGQPFLH